MSNHVVDLFEKLEANACPACVFETATDFFEDYDFDAVNIGLVSISDQRFLGGFSNMSSDYPQHYIDSGYPMIDPRLNYCYENKNEKICDLESNLRLPQTQSPETRQLFHDAIEAGQNSSLLIPRRSLASDRMLMINLVSGAQTQDLTACYEEYKDEIMLGAALIQTALLEAVEGANFGKYWYPGASNTASLTAREKEVLKWLSNGKRVDQIAHILGVANATVNFHIQNLKKKLGAQTREQAVAMALRRHLINA